MVRINSSLLSGKLTSVILVAFFGLTALPTATSTVTTFPFSFGNVDEAVDSLTTFAFELNETIDRLIALNPDLPGNAPAPLLHTKTPGYLSTGVRSSEIFPDNVFQMRSGSSVAKSVLDQLFASDEERIDQGLRIRSLPISSPVEGTITSGFGMRNHPILRRRRAHKGLDIAAPTGTEIFAPGRGVVTFSGRKNGYGNTVIVDHGYGYTTLYAHCSKLLVEKGASVSRGDVIALVGSTGRSTGPHLHYEVRINGTHMNPSAFIFYSREEDERLDMISKWYLTV